MGLIASASILDDSAANARHVVSWRHDITVTVGKVITMGRHCGAEVPGGHGLQRTSQSLAEKPRVTPTSISLFESRDAFSTRRLWPFCVVDMASRLAIGLRCSPWPAEGRDRL